MAQGDFLDWLNEDGGDRYVQRKLEAELQDAYAFQARESSAIRSQMTQLTGSLEQRLDRLAKAFLRLRRVVGPARGNGRVRS
jgi:hypothetical protein